MAVYRYGDEEYNDSLSANRVRVELEKQDSLMEKLGSGLEDLDKEEKQQARNARKRAENERNIQRYHEETMRHMGMPKDNDQISREIRAVRETDKFVSRYAMGMVSEIASCAQKEIQCKNVERSIADLQTIHATESDTRMNDFRETQKRTLDDWNREVASRMEIASAGSNAYYVEYHDKRKEAEMVIRKADESYAASKKDIDKDERDADDAYKNVKKLTDEIVKKAEIELKKQTDESERVRNDSLKRAENDYKRSVAEIKQNYSGEERNRRLQSAETKRNDVIRTANETHTKAVEVYQNKYKEKVEPAKQELSVAAEKHNQKLERIAERRDEIKIKRDTVINHQNDVIRTAQIKYKTEVQKVQNEATNAQVRRDNYLANAKIIDQRDKQVAEQKSVSVMRPTGNSSKDALKYISLVNSRQTDVGAEIVSAIGTHEEKALVHRVAIDRAEAAKAKAEGRPFTSSLSNEDKKAYQEVIKKHVGDIATENNIKASVQRLDLAEATLRKTIASNDNVLKTLKTEGSQIDTQIAAINKTLNPVREAKQMLKDGKNADGSNLTRAERSQLVQTIKNAGDLDKQVKDLNVLIQKRQMNLNSIKETEQSNNQMKGALAAAVSQKEILEKNGKVIANTFAASKGFFNLKKVDQDAGVMKKVGTHAVNALNVATKSAGFVLFQETRKNALKAQEDKRNLGKSEAQIAAKAKAQQLVKQSSDKLQQKASLLLQKDNAIHYELMSQGKNVQKFANKVQKNLKTFEHAKGKLLTSNFNNYGIVKIIKGGQARKADRIAQKIAKNGGVETKGMKVAAFAKKAGGFAGRAAVGGAIGFFTLPSQVAAMPNKILNYTMHQVGYGASKAGGAAYRTTRKMAGTVITKTKAGIRKGYDATLGRGVNKLKGAVINSRAGQAAAFARKKMMDTKLYQKAASWATRLKAKMPAFVKTTFSKVGSFFKFMFGGWKELLFSIIVFILNLVFHLFLIVVASLIIFVLLMSVLVIFFALLASLITAIMNLWQQAFAQNQSYVKNNPEFIINQAVNYRNAELDIYNLFYRANLKENEDDTGTIKTDVLYPSTDPIYHSIFDKRFNLKKLFSWFKPIAESTFLIDAKNEKAKEIKDNLDTIVKSFPYDAENETQWKVKSKGGLGFENFKSDVKGYQAALLNYYHMENPGEKGTSRSRCEISNTKAAVSLVDALYVDDPEEMQKVEVVAYLGVGEYQPANDADEAENSLFWLTHNISYNEGNSDEDIWFHMTVQQEGGRNFIINNNKAYYPKAKTTGNTHSAGAIIDPICNCSENNMEKYKVTIEHKVKETYTDHETVSAGHSESECPNWMDGCPCTTTVEVEKERWVDEEEEISFDVCKGHILLDARIDVASLKGPTGDDERSELFFELAQEIPKQDEVNKKALITINRDAEIWGVGGLKTHAYDPEEAWQKNSDLCNLARVKNDAEFEYDSPKDKNITTIADILNNKQVGAFYSLSKSRDNKVLYNIVVNKTIYRLPSFIDGEQKKVPAYEGLYSNTLTDVTTGMTVHGLPVIY